MARSVYDTFVPAGMPFITERKANWVTTTVTAGQPRPQNLDPSSIVISTILGASGEFIDTGVTFVTTLGYAVAGDMEPTRFKLSATPTTLPTLNDAYIVSQNGRVFINDMPTINIKSLGAVGGMLEFASGTIDGGNLSRVTVVGATFTAADVGKMIQVNMAGNQAAPPTGTNGYHTSTIATVVSATVVDMAAPAFAAATAQPVYVAVDDTTPISKACRAAATLKRAAYVPSGVYATTRSLSGTNGYGDFHIFGDGITSRLVHWTAVDPPGTADATQMRFVGAYVSRTFLDGPHEQNIDVITVLSTTGIVQGDYISLRDKSQPIVWNSSDAGTVACYVGEIVRVKAVLSATQLQLYSILENSYVGSAVAGPPDLRTDIRELSAPPLNIRIHDLSLEHIKSFNSTTTGVNISVVRTVATTIRDITFRGVNYAGITHATTVDLVVTDCRWQIGSGPEDVINSGTNFNQMAYGIEGTGGAWNTQISNCYARRLRHFYTGGGALDIAPQHMRMSNVMATECFGPQFDTHPGCRNMTFIDCHANGADFNPLVSIAGMGFQMRGDYIDLINCTASGVSIGFYLAYGTRQRVINCSTFNTQCGFKILNNTYPEFRNCQVNGAASIGVYVTITAPLTVYPGLIMDNIQVYGNPNKVSTVDEYQTELPCAFQFGTWTTPGVFVPLWRDDWILNDLYAPDATVKFNGLPNNGPAYGFEQPAVALYESFDRRLIENAALAALTTATLRMVGVQLTKGETISVLGFMAAAVPVAPTNTWMALYSPARAKLGVTNDTTTTVTTADVMTEFTLTAPYKVPASGLYYVAICQLAGTTCTVRGLTSFAASTGLAPILGGNSTAGQTVPGSAPTTAAAITAGSVIPYVYVR